MSAPRRVLLVDDEPELLHAFARHLALDDGIDWTLELATSGEEAVRRLDADPIDVVVTDLVMPGVDGRTVLEHCIRRHPEVARILFTGRVDFVEAGSLLALAHQFLTKPCDAPTLVAVVERAAGLRELLEDAALRSLACGVTSLPPSFRSFAALTQALDDPRTGHGELAAIIDGDPALAARVLHIANTALFSGGRHPVSEVRGAVGRLGVQVVRALALDLAASTPEGGRPRGARSFSPDALRDHALRVAALARHLSPPGAIREAAGTAGLLHDVGTLLLATRTADAYERMAAATGGRTARSAPLPGTVRNDGETSPDGLDRLAAERRFFGATHAALGGYLLGLWGMPSPVVGAIAGHHDPRTAPEGPARELAAIVCLADAVASAQEERPPATAELAPALELVGATVDDLTAWRAWLDERALEPAA